MKKKKLLMMLLFVSVFSVVTNVFAYKCDSDSNLDYVGCGTGDHMVTGIPSFIPSLVSLAVTIMRVAIPVVLIVTGTIEMFKSIISGNPDNIGKSRKRVINKYIGALLAFFIISFTTNIVKLIARGEKSTVASCFNCYLNNKCIDNQSACKGVGKESEIDSNKSNTQNTKTTSQTGDVDEAVQKCRQFITFAKSKEELINKWQPGEFDKYMQTSYCETAAKRQELKNKLIEVLGEDVYNQYVSQYLD